MSNSSTAAADAVDQVARRARPAAAVPAKPSSVPVAPVALPDPAPAQKVDAVVAPCTCEERLSALELNVRGHVAAQGHRWQTEWERQARETQERQETQALLHTLEAQVDDLHLRATRAEALLSAAVTQSAKPRVSMPLLQLWC